MDLSTAFDEIGTFGQLLRESIESDAVLLKFLLKDQWMIRAIQFIHENRGMDDIEDNGACDLIAVSSEYWNRDILHGIRGRKSKYQWLRDNDFEFHVAGGHAWMLRDSFDCLLKTKDEILGTRHDILEEYRFHIVPGAVFRKVICYQSR